MKTIRERFNDKWTPEPYSGCWLWTGAVEGKGYGSARDNCSLTKGAHRVSYSIFRGQIPNGLHVLHHCDTPLCVNPSHLFLGTNSDNRKDCIIKGRDADRRGEKNVKAKLSDSDIREIRASEGTLREIAARFGLNWQHVSDIRRRRFWKHVT